MQKNSFCEVEKKYYKAGFLNGMMVPYKHSVEWFTQVGYETTQALIP